MIICDWLKYFWNSRMVNKYVICVIFEGEFLK